MLERLEELFPLLAVALIIAVVVVYRKFKSEEKGRIKVEKELSLLQVENKRKDTTIEALVAEKKELLRQKTAHSNNLEAMLSSNLRAMPWLAGMMADYLTYDLEIEAKKLDWGHNVQRAHKVASIREIRAEAKRRIEEAKTAVYQLEYLKQLYPAIDDILETDFSDLDLDGTIPEYDPIRKYLEKEEWLKLSPSEKNQLALDRYIESRKKSKWQIGRDYELAIAYEYRQKGFDVDTHGSYAGLEDMGRDLIATRGDTILVIQCKYWGREKIIHEKHIFQLFGSVVSYCMENELDIDKVKGVFVTNIALSPTAKRVADYLGISVAQNHKMVEFPRIKCNVGKDEYGITHIYHLPMDNQYDATKIEKPGECSAFTVEEAEMKGFRRAYKWHGNS